ncbi:MAG TPA: hypothetical protein VMF69_04860 [Gemmataceae bacterium]|nr:hypothetical protein [Gemmataceae bacterium]
MKDTDAAERRAYLKAADPVGGRGAVSGLHAAKAKEGWKKPHHATLLTFRPDTGNVFTKR